jgi:hypothetical protein
MKIPLFTCRTHDNKIEIIMKIKIIINRSNNNYNNKSEKKYTC